MTDKIQALVKDVDFIRRTLEQHKKAEQRHIENLKTLALYQQYLIEKQCRLDMSKEVKASEDDLRQALIEAQRIDGDDRHPAVKAVTRKATYKYQTKDAVEWAMDNQALQYLTIDKAKFDAYLAHLADIGEALPVFAWPDEAVSVALVSDLSDLVQEVMPD